MNFNKVKLKKISNIKIHRLEFKFLLKLYNFYSNKKINLRDKTINYKDHLKWYEINKKKLIIFIIKSLSKNIGYIRFELSKIGIILSIALLSSARNKNYGSFCLKKSIEIIKKKYPKKKIIVYVKKNNILSKNFFEKNEFIKKRFFKNIYTLELNEKRKKIYK